MAEDDDFNPTKFDNSILDIETNTNEDVEIKPERYINQASFMILNALNDPDYNKAVMRASSIVLYMESICRADNKLPIDYEKNVNDYKEKEKLTNNIADLFKLANKKYELIMSFFFSNKPLKKPLKSYSNDILE